MPFIVSAGGNVNKLLVAKITCLFWRRDVYYSGNSMKGGWRTHVILKSNDYWNPWQSVLMSSTFGDETKKGTVSPHGLPSLLCPCSGCLTWVETQHRMGFWRSRGLMYFSFLRTWNQPTMIIYFWPVTAVAWPSSEFFIEVKAWVCRCLPR